MRTKLGPAPENLQVICNLLVPVFQATIAARDLEHLKYNDENKTVVASFSGGKFKKIIDVSMHTYGLSFVWKIARGLS